MPAVTVPEVTVPMPVTLNDTVPPFTEPPAVDTAAFSVTVWLLALNAAVAPDALTVEVPSAWITVESLALASWMPASETLARFTCGDAAPPATFTVTVMMG